MGIQPADLPNWMSKLQNDDYVSSLSIPGTHDSASYTRTLTPFVQTQTLNISQQLDAGIRFLDLRINYVSYLRPPNLELQLVHGGINLNLMLKDVLEQLYTWLDSHVGEALFACIKHDGSFPRPKTIADLNTDMFKFISDKSDYWRTATDIPKLSDLQFTSGSKQHGKIQLIRRFDLVGPVQEINAGLNATNWSDNSNERTFAASPPSSVKNVTIQDHYDWVYADGDARVVLEKKSKIVNSLMTKATLSTPPSNMWFFNFVSAQRSALFPSALITPFQFAHGLYDVDLDPTFIKGENTRVSAFLKAATIPMRYGVLLLDFPTDSEAPDLVFQIVQNNTFKP